MRKRGRRATSAEDTVTSPSTRPVAPATGAGAVSPRPGSPPSRARARTLAQRARRGGKLLSGGRAMRGGGGPRGGGGEGRAARGGGAGGRRPKGGEGGGGGRAGGGPGGGGGGGGREGAERANAPEAVRPRGVAYMEIEDASMRAATSRRLSAGSYRGS